MQCDNLKCRINISDGSRLNNYTVKQRWFLFNSLYYKGGSFLIHYTITRATIMSKVTFFSNDVKYTLMYDGKVTLSMEELWMRSVYRHQCKSKMSKQARTTAFCKQFDNDASLRYLKRTFKGERDRQWKARVTYKTTPHSKRTLSQKEYETRAIKRIKKATRKMKTIQTGINRAISALIRYGLLKSGGKYDQFKKLHNTFARTAPTTYGITPARYPPESEIKDLAYAIFHHSSLLTESPDWTVRYSKGRSKIVSDELFDPSQQITLSNLDPDQYASEEQVCNAILATLQTYDMQCKYIKVGKRIVASDNIKIAAYVYFESAYHARCALKPLRTLGRVFLGRTIVTARVVASKPINIVKLLLSEADGPLADPDADIKLVTDSSFTVDIQEWIDKDGRVTFIKIKLIDLTCKVFKCGSSRVSNLLEYVGDENECRRFYPTLVDEFYECNKTPFVLITGVVVHVRFRFTSGDHKAAWAKTGRSGGNDLRDLFDDLSNASLYHVIAYQGVPQFNYNRYVRIWRTIQAKMHEWKEKQVNAQTAFITQKAEKTELSRLYHIHGRVERAPALSYGQQLERPSVYNKLLLTPLVLHNQSYCCLTTLQIGLDNIVTDDSKKLHTLQGRLQGLLDGIGTTKCATSGTGLRNLINDCLHLESDTQTELVRFAPIWYLMDTICHHLHLTGKTKEGTWLALTDPERLCFTTCTFMWWCLVGDLSSEIGGRELKTGQKNHLEDKVYSYELANACPEWEEHHRVPLHLIDESLFEATFAFRDEMITAVRSKVNIETERVIQSCRDIINTIAPPRQQTRSAMSGLPKHERRNIIVRECWQGVPKWSFNIGSGLLSRICHYSYHARIRMTQDTNALYFDVTGPSDPFFTPHEQPDIVIDPCGQCHDAQVPTSFTHPLRVWFFLRRYRRIAYLGNLGRCYAIRLKEGHLRRATKLHACITEELKKEVTVQDEALICRCHKGYTIYNGMYPNDVAVLPTSSRLIWIIQRGQRCLDLWDGDISGLPQDLSSIGNAKRIWTVRKLKTVLRFFKFHGVKDDRIKFSGKRAELVTRVISVLRQYKSMSN